MGKSTKPAAVLEGDRYLTKKQIADFLQIGMTNVYLLTNRKQNPLPSMRIGKLIRFQKDVVKAWVASQGH